VIRIRCFIAVPLEQELIKKVVLLQNRFKEFSNCLKFVEPQNLHFTLKFLGEINEFHVNRVKEIIEEIKQNFSPFRIKLRGVGVFPNENYIRVVWVAVKEGKDMLAMLMKEIDERVSQLGFTREKEYIPHLTIFRVKFRPDEHFVKLLNELREIEIGEMEVNTIVLYESILQKPGPIYKEIFRCSL
jgi:2'-5' RNA ligase